MPIQHPREFFTDRKLNPARLTSEHYHTTRSYRNSSTLRIRDYAYAIRIARKNATRLVRTGTSAASSSWLNYHSLSSKKNALTGVSESSRGYEGAQVMLMRLCIGSNTLYLIVARRSSTYMVHGTLHADRFVTEKDKRGDLTPPIYGYT